jgi:hypothetical protein
MTSERTISVVLLTLVLLNLQGAVWQKVRSELVCLKTSTVSERIRIIWNIGLSTALPAYITFLIVLNIRSTF